MVGLQIAVTPPHPPPSSDERAPSTRLEVIVKQRTGPFLVKSICWAAAAAEAAVILATHAPSLTLSQTVLSTLVRGRGSDRIQLSPLFVFGTLLTGLGGYIRYRCYRALGRLFTFEMSIRNDHKLITDGPYGIVRHPGYTGILFTITGIICWHESSGQIGFMGERVWSIGNDNRTGRGGDISGHGFSYHNGIDEPHVKGRRGVARNIPEGMGPMGR